MQTDTATKRLWLASLMLGLAVALVCYVFFSSSIDDMDGALFWAGVLDFDLLRTRPHPPGYPVYIFLGKILAATGLGPRAALTLLSCIGAGFAASMLPWIYRRIGLQSSQALSLSILLVAVPIYSMTGCKILTDPLGFAVFTLALFCLLRKEGGSGLAVGALVAIGIGIRPHGFLVLLPLFFQRSVKSRLLGLLLGSAVVWGSVFYVQGFDATLRAMEQQATWRFRTPGISVFSRDMTLPDLWERAWMFQRSFFASIFDAQHLWLKLLSLALLAYGTITLALRPKKDIADPRVRAWLLGTVIYGLFIFAFLPSHPRYLLPALPVLFLIFTRGSVVVTAFLLVLTLPGTYRQVSLLQEHRSPADLALEWMDERDPERAFPLVNSRIAAHARVLSPERVEEKSLFSRGKPTHAKRYFVTDLEPWCKARLSEGRARILAHAAFERAPIIHEKYTHVEAWWIERVDK